MPYADPEKKRAADRARYQRNREKILARQRDYYQRNREAVIERATKWNTDNPARRRTIARDSAARNPERLRKHRQLRRARARNARTDDAQVPFEGEACAYCGAPAECVDHVYPLAHYLDDRACNKVPACRSCNSAKSDSHPLAWLLRLAVLEAA
jgi:hypothetical protein